MRMWMIDPKILCTKHLLGEHVETHMFIGTIIKGKSLDGYVNNNLLEFRQLYNRHQKLADEMKRRNMNHKSPLPSDDIMIKKYPDNIINSKVNVNKALNELLSRCPECLKRYNELN